MNQKNRITRIHIEEDGNPIHGAEEEDYSLVDFNRAGVPFIEIVSNPDIRNQRRLEYILIKNF